MSQQALDGIPLGLRLAMNLNLNVHACTCSCHRVHAPCTCSYIVSLCIPCSDCRPARPTRPVASERDEKVPSTSLSRVGGAGVSSSRSVPRLDMGVATRQILTGIGHSASSRGGREGRRREREGGGTAVGEKTAGKKLEVEHNRVPTSGTYSVTVGRSTIHV